MAEKKKLPYEILRVGDKLFSKRIPDCLPVKKFDPKLAYGVIDIQENVSQLQCLESRFAKTFFKVLLVNKDVTATANLLNVLQVSCGFEVVRIAQTFKDAWDELKSDTKYDMVISNFRDEEENDNCFKIHKWSKMLDNIPQFFVIDGNSALDPEDFSKHGLVLIKNPTDEKIRVLIQSFYAKKLIKIVENKE